MITFGTIGTNWITSSFIESAHATGKFQLTHVYSRTESTAQSFASKYDAKSCTSIDALDVDVVYIASPNSLHFEQAKQLLLRRKHVIVEKPATSTPAELNELFATAKENGVFLLEAYRHIHEANFSRLDLARLGPIFGASLTYASYSSRYNNVLAGETPNIFSLDFSGGCLVDLGCYCVSFAVALFGKPESQIYAPYICRTGVDAGGPILLRYPSFGVQINQSKCYTSFASSEIYGENGTLTISGTTDIDGIKFWDRKTKETIELAGPKAKLNLQEEAEEFARIILEKDHSAAAKLEQISRDVVAVTSDLRKQNGIVFAAERK